MADNSRLDDIAKTFAVDKDSVEGLSKQYKEFSGLLAKQYLAHALRAVECYFRKRLNNERFIVICEPYKEFDPQHQLTASSCYYSPKSSYILSSDKRRDSFIINYNPNLPEKELVDHIAHEIGYLFSRTMAHEKNVSINNIESFSSIFGLFLMAEKNDFYANFDAQANHRKWDELLAAFAKMGAE